MNKYIIAVLVAILSVALGGCGGQVVHRTVVVSPVPVSTHHHREGEQVVSKTTTVETERHGGTVVKKTTVVVRKRAVDCSSRNPYRDEYTPSSPCYWKKHLY